jgi:hypothetical protein
MKIFYIYLLVVIFSLKSFAAEDHTSKLWTDGKVTPDQPFKAKVVAAGGVSPWSGETVIYLREDVVEGRFLEVRIGFSTGNGVRYTPIKNQEVFDKIVKGLTGYGATVFIDPVEISRFVWASPMGGVGEIFGDKDLVKMAYALPSKKAVQADVTQPATRSELNSDGGDKVQPESEGHSR